MKGINTRSGGERRHSRPPDSWTHSGHGRGLHIPTKPAREVGARPRSDPGLVYGGASSAVPARQRHGRQRDSVCRDDAAQDVLLVVRCATHLRRSRGWSSQASPRGSSPRISKFQTPDIQWIMDTVPRSAISCATALCSRPGSRAVLGRGYRIRGIGRRCSRSLKEPNDGRRHTLSIDGARCDPGF